MTDIPFPEFAPLPDENYRTVVADPPWAYDDTLPGDTRGAESHYETLPTGMIAGMGPQIRAATAPSAHLYLWCTNGFVADAHDVAEAWGFDPKTLVTWVKVLDEPSTLPHERDDSFEVVPRIGMGHYFRNTTEHMLFATKSNRSTNRNDTPTHFFAERTEHSAKPTKAYRLVEAMSDGPYLELFARNERENWDVWGKEA